MTRPKALTLVSLVLLLGVTVKPSANETPSSRFYFPHIVSGNGAETTFVISNSSAQDAEVRFSAYGDEGNLLAVRSNAATVTVAAQSRGQIKAGDLFDIPDGASVAGWMKAESSNPQLSAWMLISLGNIQGDSLDGLGASDEVSQKMIFSAVFQTAETLTGIGLANPGGSTAHVTANLYSEGRLVEVREFQVPGYGHRAWLLNQLFQANVATGHVEVVSDVGLVGLETFSQADRWSAVPMQAVENVSEVVVPVPLLQGRVSMTIALVNLQENDLNLSLTAYGPGAQPAAGPVTRVIKPHSELITPVSDLFGDLALAGGVIIGETDVGLERILGLTHPLSGLAVLRGQDFKGLASFSLSRAQSRESIFSPLGIQSSLWMLNSSDAKAITRLSMVGSGRRVVGANEITIDPHTSVSGGLIDLAKATEAGNLVLLSAAQPLTTLQIESSAQGTFIIAGQTFKSRAVYSSGQLLSRVSGGTVLSKDETVSLSVPLNALDEDVAVEVNRLLPETAPPLESNRRLLAATEFLPAATQFRFPAAIQMPLLRTQTPMGSIPLELVNPLTGRYESSGTAATISSDGMSATAWISHFSIFALTAERPTISVTPSPVTLQVGGTTQFTATVSGDGVQDIEWSVNGITGGSTVTGSIRPAGLYSAPATVPPLGWVSVRAALVNDPGSFFDVQVTIRPTPAPAPTPAAGPGPDPGSDPIVLEGPVDPGCAQCHAYR